MKAAAKIIEETGADYVHMIPSAELQSGILSMVSAVPTTIFVDSKGKPADFKIKGIQDASYYMETTETMLKK
mgnify:CR=1 FL=1